MRDQFIIVEDLWLKIAINDGRILIDNFLNGNLPQGMIFICFDLNNSIYKLRELIGIDDLLDLKLVRNLLNFEEPGNFIDNILI